MRKYWLLIIFFVLGVSCLPRPEVYTNFRVPVSSQEDILSITDPEYRTVSTEVYDSGLSNDQIDDPQCPIPMKDRVPNYTGIQCVFSSTETVGRWAEYQALVNPPLTSRPECKSYSSPRDLSRKLKNLGVDFKQTYGDRARGIQFIKKAMEEGRGCYFGVPGHCMTLVHYDEDIGIVGFIDNSDRSLKIQKISMSRFNRIWDTWVGAVYAPVDKFKDKKPDIQPPPPDEINYLKNKLRIRRAILR
jgi:hypothetical protein